MPSYYYIDDGTSTAGFSRVGVSEYNSKSVGFKSTVENGIEPTLAFNFIKKKFGILEGTVLKRRLDKLEKAFSVAVSNGQDTLAKKFLNEVVLQTKESVIYAKGIKLYVERDDVMKVKNKLKDGKIADTKLEDYTKIVPDDVIKIKNKLVDVFDGFVVYHYYNDALEDKVSKAQKITPEEKAKMKDPILFGYINESDRLYFIADWESDECDFTFDEIVELVGETRLNKYPTL